MSSSNVMDTTIDDLKSTEKKLEALKMEVARQEEMEVLKTRIEQDTARLRSLQQGDAKQYKFKDLTSTPVITNQEATWLETFANWHYKAKCKVTGRAHVFCMCGQCVKSRKGSPPIKLTKWCAMCGGGDRDVCNCSPCS